MRGRQLFGTWVLLSLFAFAAAPAAAVCGDGMLDGIEQCDAGAANGAAGSCCAADCTNIAFGTPCPDTQPNNCKRAACENGFCNQSSVTLEPNDSACGADATAGDCVAPLCVNGTCVANRIFVAGTACTLTEELECRLAQCNGTDTTCGINIAFGTLCTDTQPNNCKKAACENGFCNQNSITLEPNESACGADATPGDCVGPRCLFGTCDPARIFPAGTACTLTEELECRTAQCNGTITTCGINLTFGTLCTDTQPTNCKKAACENGFCNQNSITIEPNGSPCGADPDPADCFAPLCQSAVCDTRPLPLGTACPDGSTRDCLAAQCDGAGVCDQGGGFVPAGIFCTDTTPADHFRSECDGAGLCNQQAEEIRAVPALSPIASALALGGLLGIAALALWRRR
jgi:hypothetical protein